MSIIIERPPIRVDEEFQITIYLHRPTNLSDIKAWRFPWAADITNVKSICDSGSITFTGGIDGVDLGGTANSVSTTEDSEDHSSANSGTEGDYFTWSGTSNSLCKEAVITVTGVRTA